MVSLHYMARITTLITNKERVISFELVHLNFKASTFKMLLTSVLSVLTLQLVTAASILRTDSADISGGNLASHTDTN